MAQVITFRDVQPTPRYDGTAWTAARIEEAATPDAASWTTVETITLDPVDSNPEHPATRNLTTELASDTDGLWYRVVFVDASGDELQPTDPIQNVAATPGTLYITPSELRATLNIGSDYADADIEDACEAASRVIDAACGRRFYSDDTDRYFTADRYATHIRVGDITSLTSVTVDTDGDGTYETTWAVGTDFYLEPVSSAWTGEPYTTIRLRSQASRSFPYYDRAIKVVGTFGRATVPAEVKQYAKILAAQLLLRSRQAPFGFQVIAGDVAGAARIARTDPDFQRLLGHYVTTPLLV